MNGGQAVEDGGAAGRWSGPSESTGSGLSGRFELVVVMKAANSGTARASLRRAETIESLADRSGEATAPPGWKQSLPSLTGNYAIAGVPRPR